MNPLQPQATNDNITTGSGDNSNSDNTYQTPQTQTNYTTSDNCTYTTTPVEGKPLIMNITFNCSTRHTQTTIEINLTEWWNNALQKEGRNAAGRATSSLPLILIVLMTLLKLCI